ncbi:MAG: hypothetical protein IT340_06540 [Chloroflexi bacterium]|nr:hypothetical protein [Chloroflexota bacterium]
MTRCARLVILLLTLTLLPPTGAGPAPVGAATARVRVAAGGPWLEVAGGQRLFVYGINYQGPADQAWQMWEPAWFDRQRIAADLDRMRAGGYTVARIFVQAPLSADLAANRFERLDWVLDQADARGLRVILTLADDGENRVPVLTARAGQLARRYAGRGVILAYDLKNEPQFGTFGTALYPAGQPVPLLDHGLVAKIGARLTRAEARAWRASADGRALTPARFSDDDAYVWANAVAAFRAYLDAAADWANDRPERSSGDFATAPEAAPWQPFLAALSDTMLIWLAPQVEAIRAADPGALVTTGYNNVVLAVQPANTRLQVQSFHRFPTPGGGQWRGVFAALASVQRAFPSAPLLLEEFGYSNQTRAGQHVDEDQTAAHETAVWLELARRGYTGGLKWMLYDFDQGANPYENAFGALRGDGSPKPAFLAARALAAAGGWRVSSLDLTSSSADLAFVARGPSLLVTAGPQRLPEMSVATETSALLVVTRTGSRLTLTATRPAEVRLDTAALLGAPPSRVRPEDAGGTPRVEGDRLVLALGGSAPVTLRVIVERPTGRVAPLAVPAGQGQYFNETGHNLLFGFKSYWERNGGLAIYGYPLTEEFKEINPADGKEYTVQYFERARFEYHPEHKGTPHETQLGLLGRQVTAGREEEPPFRRLRDLPDTPERRFFAATSHTLFGGFRLYWERYGGLAQFGYPISEEFREVNPADGKAYTVQYFERARFEYHPEHKGTPYEVELGLLGWQTVMGA